MIHDSYAYHFTTALQSERLLGKPAGTDTDAMPFGRPGPALCPRGRAAARRGPGSPRAAPAASVREVHLDRFLVRASLEAAAEVRQIHLDTLLARLAGTPGLGGRDRRVLL